MYVRLVNTSATGSRVERERQTDRQTDREQGHNDRNAHTDRDRQSDTGNKDIKVWTERMRQRLWWKNMANLELTLKEQK